MVNSSVRDLVGLRSALVDRRVTLLFTAASWRVKLSSRKGFSSRVMVVTELLALAFRPFCDRCTPDGILPREEFIDCCRWSSVSRAEWLAEVTFLPSMTIGAMVGGADFFGNSTRTFFAVDGAGGGLTFGWRSTAGRVIRSGLEEMIETGSEADDSDEPGRLKSSSCA